MTDDKEFNNLQGEVADQAGSTLGKGGLGGIGEAVGSTVSKGL